MIPISHKNETRRQATAEGTLALRPETLRLVRENRIPKGNALETARVAGILASKKTPDWIPFCHPLPLEGCRVDFSLEEDRIAVTATVEAVAKTGVEMEALASVAAACLTLYDMLKPVDDTLVISQIKLISKEGGKSQFCETLPENFRAAVIVTSDGTHAGTRKDKSGRLIVERLREYGIAAIDYLILPDERGQIERALRDFCAKRYHLIATTGGSGLGPRDVTVEATRAVIEREVPGAAEAMRGYGQRRTPYAMLSRGLVGVRGKTFIVNFPGSSRGTEESMNAVFPSLFHGFGMMNGEGH